VQINVQRKIRQNLKPAATILLLLLPNANSGILKTPDEFPLHPSFAVETNPFVHKMHQFMKCSLLRVTVYTASKHFQWKQSHKMKAKISPTAVHFTRKDFPCLSVRKVRTAKRRMWWIRVHVR